MVVLRVSQRCHFSLSFCQRFVLLILVKVQRLFDSSCVEWKGQNLGEFSKERNNQPTVDLFEKNKKKKLSKPGIDADCGGHYPFWHQNKVFISF